MNLLLAAMAVSIVLGMMFRHQQRAMRILVMLLSIGVTTLYFVFADRLM